jgi:hypothetical protein
MLKRFFLDHPRSIGETYFEHQRHAFRFASSLFGGAIACFIHGVVPAFFLTTGSETVRNLHSRMSHRRPREIPTAAAWVRESDYSI